MDRFTAFDGDQKVTSGTLAAVAAMLKARLDQGGLPQFLVFDDATGKVVDLDPRHPPTNHLGPRATAAPYLEEASPRGPGRPKLGVVAREVTLLPRHWDWLNAQPGGASVSLRKLVDAARHANAEADRIRDAREAAYRVMSALAGDRPGFEAATRALWQTDHPAFTALIAPWPEGVRDYVAGLAEAAFAGPSPSI